uniref:Uncharacterized protein n=1 Tax=Anguilla anguilla TaxID=7936 RepID=A0A0E9QLM0_ANGAN
MFPFCIKMFLWSLTFIHLIISSIININKAVEGME